MQRPRHAGCAGDICVYFEPGATLVRLYGRVDSTMRKDLVEAAFDVVDRGAPVTIEVAPDADVQPGVLQFLRHVCELSVGEAADPERAARAEGAEGAAFSCARGREAGVDDAGRLPDSRRLPRPRTVIAKAEA